MLIVQPVIDPMLRPIEDPLLELLPVVMSVEGRISGADRG